MQVASLGPLVSFRSLFPWGGGVPEIICTSTDPPAHLLFQPLPGDPAGQGLHTFPSGLSWRRGSGPRDKFLLRMVLKWVHRVPRMSWGTEHEGHLGMSYVGSLSSPGHLHSLSPPKSTPHRLHFEGNPGQIRYGTAHSIK